MKTGQAVVNTQNEKEIKAVLLCLLKIHLKLTVRGVFKEPLVTDAIPIIGRHHAWRRS
jgi:hypothetical protein